MTWNCNDFLSCKCYCFYINLFNGKFASIPLSLNRRYCKPCSLNFLLFWKSFKSFSLTPFLKWAGKVAPSSEYSFLFGTFSIFLYLFGQESRTDTAFHRSTYIYFQLLTSMAFLTLFNSEMMLDFRKDKWMNELRNIQALVAGFPPWQFLVMWFISVAKNQKWDAPSIFFFFATIPLHMCTGIKIIWRITQCTDTILRLCRAQRSTEIFFRWDRISLMFAEQPVQWGWDSSQAPLAFHCLFHIHFYLAQLLHISETTWP